jgi:hypothetical protein
MLATGVGVRRACRGSSIRPHGSFVLGAAFCPKWKGLRGRCTARMAGRPIPNGAQTGAAATQSGLAWEVRLEAKSRVARLR